MTGRAGFGIGVGSLRRVRLPLPQDLADLGDVVLVVAGHVAEEACDGHGAALSVGSVAMPLLCGGGSRTFGGWPRRAGVDDEEVVAGFYRVLRNAVIDHYRSRSSSARVAEVWGRKAANIASVRLQLLADVLPYERIKRSDYSD